MAFEIGIVLKNLKTVVIIPLYKGEGERAECRSISLQSVVEKDFALVLVNRVCKVTAELIDEGCRSGRECANHIFALKWMDEKQ